MVEAQLVGDSKFPQGPMLLEATDRLRDEMGLQLVDEFIQLTIMLVLKFSLPTPRELPNKWKNAPRSELPYLLR